MDFSLPSIIYLQQIYILEMWENMGYFIYHAELLLSPMSWYHNADVWAFLKPMIMTEHKKMVQMPYLDIRSMLLSGQVPYNTNSSQFFRNRLFQKKNKRGWGHTFLKKFWKKSQSFFCISLYPWKFQAKQSPTLRNLVKLCMLHSSEISRPKN